MKKKIQNSGILREKNRRKKISMYGGGKKEDADKEGDPSSGMSNKYKPNQQNKRVGLMNQKRSNKEERYKDLKNGRRSRKEEKKIGQNR